MSRQAAMPMQQRVPLGGKQVGRKQRPSIQGMEFVGISGARISCSSTLSGWLGSWLGQCCGSSQFPEAEMREPLVHIGDQVIETWGPRLPVRFPVHRHMLQWDDDDSAAGVHDRALEAAIGFHLGPAGEYYLIENSILQAQGHPGVGYRRSKCETDRVGEEHWPALWGDIVLGVDEGDGWLKVGQYFLPMTHKGMPVLSLLPMSDDSFTASPCGGAGMAGASALASLPVEAVGSAALRTIVTDHDDVGSPWEEMHETKWHLRPSVGTWLRIVPSGVSNRALVQEDQMADGEGQLNEVSPYPQACLEEEPADVLLYSSAASVPEITAELEILDEESVPTDPLFLAEIVGKPSRFHFTGEHLAVPGKDGELSPSTCAPDSPCFITPLSVASTKSQSTSMVGFLRGFARSEAFEALPEHPCGSV